MKKIKYIVLFITAIASTLVSCNNDDDVVFVPREITQVQFTDAGEFLLESTVTSFTATVDFGGTLAEKALLTYSLNGVETSETIDEGTATYDITVASALGVANEIELIDVAVINDPDYAINAENNKVVAVGGPADTEELIVAINFDGEAYDLDLEILEGTVDNPGPVIVESAGVTGTESVALTGLTDGSYIVRAFEFSGLFSPATGDTISYELVVIHPQASDAGFIKVNKELVLEAFPLQIDQATENGNTTFTFTQL